MCNFVSFSNRGVVLTRKTMTVKEIDIYSGSVAGSGEGTPPPPSLDLSIFLLFA